MQVKHLFAWLAVLVWLWLGAASASAQSRIFVDKPEYGPGDMVRIEGTIPPAQPGALVFFLVKVGEPGIVPAMGTTPEVLRSSGAAPFPAPYVPGEYEVHLVAQRSGLLTKTPRFTVREGIRDQHPPKTASDDVAPPLEPVTNPEGNWEVTWHDYPEKGQSTTAAVVLQRSRETDRVRWAAGVTTDYTSWGNGRPEFNQGRLEIQWGYRILGGWGGKSTLQQISRDELRGRWSYEASKAGGVEIWRRAVPKVRQVVFTSEMKSTWIESGPAGRVEVKPGGAGKFNVRIFGENLWGSQVIDLGDDPQLRTQGVWGTYLEGTASPQPDGTTVFKETGSHEGLHNMKQIIGIQTDVILGEKFTTGMKLLRVNGISVPFEMVLNVPPPTLRSRQKGPNGFVPADPLSLEPIYVEAEYAIRLEGRTPKAQLELNGNYCVIEIDQAGKQIVIATGDQDRAELSLARVTDTLFRSKPLMFVDASSGKGCQP